MSSETHTNGGSPAAQGEVLPAVSEQPSAIDRVMDSPLPAPAMAATGGFLAGIATLVLVRVLRRSAGRPRRGFAIRRRKGDRSLEIAGSRSFLVDVHMLKR